MLLHAIFRYFQCNLWRKKKALIFMIVFLITAQPALLIAKEENISIDSIDSVYDLISVGDDIGDISILRSQQGDPACPLYLIKETVHAEVSIFWGHWELSSISKIVIDKEGVFSFNNIIKENDDNWHVSGKRHERDLWCSARKVLTKKEKDEEDVVAISSMVIEHTIPYAGESLAVLGMLSANDEGEIRIPLDSFEIVSCQFPSILMRKPKGMGRGKVMLLDTSELKIETYIFEEVDQEQIETAKHTFKCRVFSITHPNGTFTYWLAEDELGAFIVKESGKDDDGPYEIILKQYKTGETDKR